MENKDYLGKEYLTNALQKIFTKDMVEYHHLRLLAVSSPTENNQKNFNKKRKSVKKDYHLCEEDLKTLDERYDTRRYKMFYGPSPF